MTTTLLFLALTSALTLGAPSPAAPWPAPDASASRISPADGAPPEPMLALRASFLSGVPDVFGVSGSILALRPVEIEAGVSGVLMFAGAYVRGGPRFSLYSNRDREGHGVTVDASGLAGLRAEELVDYESGISSAWLWGPDAVGAVDVTYWLAPHLGLSAQLTAGGWLANVPGWSGSPATDWLAIPDGRLALGMEL